MNEPTRRVILVPIDLHGINRAALETLVHIARQLDRSLLGLLLEDIRLQRVADLPFTTEITLSGGRERSLLRDHLSQRHHKISIDTRRLLNELASRDDIQLEFEDAAGSRWHTALEKEGPLDIFFPARSRWQAPPVCHWPRGYTIRRLGVLLPRNQQPERMIEFSSALLRAGLVGDIYVLSDSRLLPEQLQKLYRPGHQVRVQSNVLCTPSGVVELILHSPFDLLLIPRECLQQVSPDALDSALDRSAGQVLVVN